MGEDWKGKLLKCFGERWGIKREERLEWKYTEGLFERDRGGGQAERWWMEAGEGEHTLID